MQRAHDSPLVGHPTLLKKYRAIKDCFSWKGLKGDVLRRLHECVVCQRNKGELSNAAGLLQLLPIPKRKWESVSMDFITRLLVVQGRDCIYVVVDILTKFSHFFSIPSRSCASYVVDLFFKEVLRLHGLPKTIVSDRDNRSMGNFWKDLFILVGKKLTPNTSYHPQTDW